MATSTGIDAASVTHVLDYGEVTARFPFFVSRMICTRVTSAANLPGDFLARALGQIHFIRRMSGSRAVTTLALHSRELRRGKFCFEAGRQTKPNGVARQAGSVLVLANRLESLQRLRVPGAEFDGMNALVTFSACLRASILRRRPGNFEECGALQIGDGGDAFQIRATSGQPVLIRQSRLLIQLIVTRRPVPCDIDAVGGLGNSCHHRATGEAARLSHAQVLNFFRAHRS